MAGRFLAIAALAVIGLLAGLWILMRDTDEPPVVVPPRDAQLTSTQAATQDAAPPAPSARPAPRTPVVMHRPTPQTPTPSAGTTAAPAIAEDAGAARPQTFTDALKEQVLLTESQLLECADKAAKSGKKLDGEAAFGFTVARKDGKVVIESTGIEYTNFDPATSDCFRDSANAMTFDSLPDGVDAITAYRKVVIADGALKRQWMTQSNVVRPPPGPGTMPTE